MNFFINQYKARPFHPPRQPKIQRIPAIPSRKKAKEIPELSEIREEKILYKTHPCRRGWHRLKKYILAFIILIIAIYINIDAMVYFYIETFSMGLSSILTYLLLIIFFLIIIINEIKRYSIKYYITKSRIVEEKGIFSKKITSLHLSIVDTMRVKTNLIDRFFKMGDVIIYVLESKVIFEDVHDPHKLEEFITQIMNKYKKSHVAYGETG